MAKLIVGSILKEEETIFILKGRKRMNAKKVLMVESSCIDLKNVEEVTYNGDTTFSVFFYSGREKKFTFNTPDDARKRFAQVIEHKQNSENMGSYKKSY